MSGYCPECGRPASSCQCRPSDLGLKNELPSKGPRLLVPRDRRVEPLPPANRPRRLLGSGVEFSAYLLGAWIITALDHVSFGLLGLAVLFLVALVLLRDANGGVFSIAKRVSQMRVVDQKTGEAASNKQAFIRNSYYLAILFLAILPLIDIVTSSFFTMFVVIDLMMILANPRGRRFGDFLAGTQVVEARI